MNTNANNSLNRWLHHVMSAVGGFMACYAILCFGNSGNAQTHNLISLTLAIVGNNLLEVLLRLGGFLIYILGTIIYVVTDHHHMPVQWISLLFDSIVILFCAFFGVTGHSVIYLYPFFFAMSYQRNCFPGANGYAAATIFSSNNTRQVALALGDYYYTKDVKKLDKAAFYFGALLFLNLGAAFCAILFNRFAERTILLCFVLLVLAAVMICLIVKIPDENNS